MKKIFALVLALMLVLTMAACGGETAPETTAAPVVEGPTQPDANSWKYTVRGVEIMMHAPAASILEALGEPVSYTEEASCAFSGLDKTYYYGGFYLQTYPLGDEDMSSPHGWSTTPPPPPRASTSALPRPRSRLSTAPRVSTAPTPTS